jgi:hypothetical protein
VSNEVNNFKFEGGLKKITLSLILLCLVGFAMSFMQNKIIGWTDYLVFSLYFTTIAVSSLFMLALGGVVQASWFTPYKRIPEAMSSFLPVAALLMGGTLLSLHTLYEWTHKDVVAKDPILSKKVAWLNEPRYIGTMILIFAIWIILGAIFRRYSDKMNSATSGIEATKKHVGFSAVAMILFALSISFASFDWIMSLEPHWFSTIFGVYIFAGSFQSGMAFITLAVITLKGWGYFKNINENHYHDFGKWMFGFSVFWAYIWISQYLLIWYANIPEETEYYVLRHHHWNTQFFFNLCINFIVPFFVLMTREAKRNAKVLKAVACLILVGHFLDLYIMVAPKVFEHNSISGVTGFGILQLIELVGGFGLFIFVIAKALSKRDLEVVNDPTYDEGIHLHQ